MQHNSPNKIENFDKNVKREGGGHPSLFCYFSRKIHTRNITCNFYWFLQKKAIISLLIRKTKQRCWRRFRVPQSWASSFALITKIIASVLGRECGSLRTLKRSCVSYSYRQLIITTTISGGRRYFCLSFLYCTAPATTTLTQLQSVNTVGYTVKVLVFIAQSFYTFLFKPEARAVRVSR